LDQAAPRRLRERGERAVERAPAIPGHRMRCNQLVTHLSSRGGGAARPHPGARAGRIQPRGARCGRSRRRNPVSRRLPLVCAIGVLGSLAAAPTGARATTRFVVTNLGTDDQTANPAKITDTELVNAWGVSYGGSGPFWVSDNKTGKSTIYAVDPTTNATSKLGLTVAIPGDGSVTGQASMFGNDTFVFASEDGTVSGWAMGTSASVLQAASTSNVYKGAAVGTIDTNTYLYLANFRAGTIDVINA